MSNNTLLLSIICLIVGFTCAYLIFEQDPEPLLESSSLNEEISSTDIQQKQYASKAKPNNINTDMFAARFESIENNINLLQQQLESIELRLNQPQNSSSPVATPVARSTTNRQQSRYRRTFNLDRLIKGGINSAIAEDIVRRKNAVEIKRLELSDRATRENFMNTQQYFDELAAIDKTEVNLREELGDDQYDSYLFTSGQSNRIKLLTVMLGSAAEQAGLEKGDIILSYDGKRMFTWSELKQATAEGELGEYTSINISRKGEVFSYSVPRGTLGIQMGSARVAP